MAHNWLLAANHTKTHPLFSFHSIPTSQLETIGCSRRCHYSWIKGPWPLLCLLPPSFFSPPKTSLRALPSSPSFIYHIFCPHRDLSERQRIPSVGNTAWQVPTQEAFDSCWNVLSFGKPSNPLDTMSALRHNGKRLKSIQRARPLLRTSLRGLLVSLTETLK